ncbi:MAG: 1-(5-phosphoribosyl)-5-((5-phosphoribosylamino)methylideneamino)imidazole-4-carboxamide isomerase [Deltaproteobacteria bacterium]|jgi:DUF971 family protein|nr:1-(5-phosphoribosyl)-5-((5-phosphoribosylamino)methylideneamino)imidazole-4-carboxamide isomerase [Deltaproteobacteria bacterium]
MRPKKITLHKESAQLEFSYPNEESYALSAEFLRISSPSAEVRGHGPGQETLQTGKRLVTIEKIESVGNYAIKLIFSDQHNSGIYSWTYLYELAKNHDELWTIYLEKMKQAKGSREPLPPGTQVINIV